MRCHKTLAVGAGLSGRPINIDTAESDVQCEVFNTLESIHCQLIVYVHLLIVYRFLGNTLWFLDAYCSGHLLIYGARAIFIGNKVQ